MLCTFHTSLFLRWEIKSWESCLVIRRVLSHAQQYALFPSCLCRDCASQWMGEWKIWEKAKTLALHWVRWIGVMMTSVREFFSGGTWHRRILWMRKECWRERESRQVFQQFNRIFARASASGEISQTLLSVDIQKHICHLPWDPVVVLVLIWSCLSFSFVHPISYHFVHSSGIKRDNDIGDTELDE